jgi:hypothetical protein
VFEDPGTVIANHGFVCAQSDRAGQEVVVNIEPSIDLPAYATDATVFLNGWRLEFLNGDHEVAGFGATITDIRTENQALKWRASGVLSDQNFDDGYKFCHFFTAVAWNQTNLRLLADHDDGSCTGTCDPESNWFDAEHDKLKVEFLARNIDGSRSSFASFLENPRLTSNRTVAVLPRGFAFRWRGCGDYELHQTAYSLNPSAKFIEQGKRYRKGTEEIVADLPNGASQADYRFVTWDSDCILKSNTIRRRYFFGEIVSGLGGNNMGVIHPPYSILPIQASGGENVGFVGVLTREFRIERVPFLQALPMLAGWDLRYEGSENEVERIGIWIDEIRYEKNAASPVGTLIYTLSSVVEDQDQTPLSSRRTMSTYWACGRPFSA